MARRKVKGPVELYRHFDANGALLYVGISGRALIRLVEHQASEWFDKIATITIERHPTRFDAAVAEVVAIIKEKPRFNKGKLLNPGLRDGFSISIGNREAHFTDFTAWNAALKDANTRIALALAEASAQ